MRLCYLADSSSIHTKKWAMYFALRGHEVHVISFDKTVIPHTIHHALILPAFIEKARRKSRSLQIIMFPFKFLITLITLRQLVKQINPDVLHAHYITNYGFFGALTGFKPYVVTAWGSDILNVLQNPLFALARNFSATIVFKKVDAVTSDANFMLKRMVSLGLNPHKTYCINFGVDIDKFKPDRAKHDTPTVISTRRLEPVYNVRTFIEAIPHILKEVPAIQFIVVGSGSEEHYLKQHAKDLDLTDKVQFLGAVDNDALPQVLNQADVYVSTSLSDAGIAMSTAEAMACELPIVITDNSDNARWVLDGCLVPNNDVEALSKGIIDVLRYTMHHSKYGQANRVFVMEHDNYQHEMQLVETLYENLSHGRSRLNWQ